MIISKKTRRPAGKIKNLGLSKRRKRVSDWVYLQCRKQKRRKKKITHGLIIDWACEAKKKYMCEQSPFYNSTASQWWVNNFKSTYGIVGEDQLNLQLDRSKNINRKNIVRIRNTDAGKNVSNNIAEERVVCEENNNKQIEKLNTPPRQNTIPLCIRNPCIHDGELTKRAADFSNYKIPVKKPREISSEKTRSCLYEKKLFLGIKQEVWDSSADQNSSAWSKTTGSRQYILEIIEVKSEKTGLIDDIIKGMNKSYPFKRQAIDISGDKEASSLADYASIEGEEQEKERNEEDKMKNSQPNREENLQFLRSIFKKYCFTFLSTYSCSKRNCYHEHNNLNYHQDKSPHIIKSIIVYAIKHKFYCYAGDMVRMSVKQLDNSSLEEIHRQIDWNFPINQRNRQDLLNLLYDECCEKNRHIDSNIHYYLE